MSRSAAGRAGSEVYTVTLYGRMGPDLVAFSLKRRASPVYQLPYGSQLCTLSRFITEPPLPGDGNHENPPGR